MKDHRSSHCSCPITAELSGSIPSHLGALSRLLDLSLDDNVSVKFVLILLVLYGSEY